MEPVKLLERAASGAAHAIRHPISSAAYTAGIVRGLAGAAIHAAGRGQEKARHVPPQRVTPVLEQDDEVPPPEPTPLHESFATEPKATSRESAHGGQSRDAEIDDWAAEAEARDDIDVETPVGTTGADVGHNPDTGEADLQQRGTEPLMDPSTTKAVKSESEMLQKDAERNPE